MMMAFFGRAQLDVIEELQKICVPSITEAIFCHLDLESLKNAKLVSKTWRAAVLATYKSVLKVNRLVKFPCVQWEKVVDYLEGDFPISVEDELYFHRLFNTTQLVTENLNNSFWCSPNFNVDYLPYEFTAGRVPHIGYEGHHVEINEKFIVAWDPASKKMKYWSRRSLSPLFTEIEMLQPYYSPEIGNPAMNFKIDNDYLFYGSVFKLDKTTFEVIVTSVKLTSVQDHDEVKIDTSPYNPKKMFVRLLRVQNGLVMTILFSLMFESPIFRLLLWKHGKLTRKTLTFKSALELPMCHSMKEYYFYDENYLVVQWEENVSSKTFQFRTYSLSEDEQNEGQVVPQILTTFEVEDPIQIQYKDGFLVVASQNGMIKFVDVTSGEVRRKIKAPIDFAWNGSLMRLSSSYLIVTCFATPLICHGSIFQVWDFKEAIRQPLSPTEPSCLHNLCMFKTLTGTLADFKFDEFGIVAVVNTDNRQIGGGPLGIQVINFLASCSACKRISSKPADLKKCTRCLSAQYCGKECQLADWHHHKPICHGVDQFTLIDEQPISFQIFTLQRNL